MVEFQNIFKTDCIFQLCFCRVGRQTFNEKRFFIADTSYYYIGVSNVNCQIILFSSRFIYGQQISAQRILFLIIYGRSAQ